MCIMDQSHYLKIKFSSKVAQFELDLDALEMTELEGWLQ